MTRRLPQQPGEWIDRDTKVSFRFEGRLYEGYAGDTISSALWAAGVRVLGRSFKYHRPRGIFSFADDDSNVMLESGEATNIRGDITQLREGLELRAVNTFGGVQGDRLRLMDRFGAFTPVGFYYKAFHSPKRLFPFYERQIRKIAGLGSINPTRFSPPSPKDYAHVDVLVVGSGPAGLSAALAAAHSGARVLVVERLPRAGGTLHYQLGYDRSLQERGAALLDEVRSLDAIELRTSTTAVGHYADGWVGLVDERRLTKIRCGAVVVATGCHEQPAVFRNNDLPGVMLATAAQRLLRHYAVRPFKRCVVFTANVDGYRAALDFQRAGVGVAAVVDLRPEGETSNVGRALREAGTPTLTGSMVYVADPTRGKRGVRSVTVRNAGDTGLNPSSGERRFECDGIAVSVGWAPADGLIRQVHGRMEYLENLEQFVPVDLPPGVFVAGRVNGVYEVLSQIDDGERAGSEAAEYVGFDSGTVPTSRRSQAPRSHPYPIVPHPSGKNFIDFDEDIQLKDIENAVAEGFDNVELLKRYSTFGMGPSQGRHSNLLSLRVLARLRGEPMAGKQTTTSRPFTTPVPLSHLAGRIFTPRRRTPQHHFHEQHDAQFTYAADWLRPEYYRRLGKSREECIAAEARSVREGVGLIDLGTLGKIELSGPDSVEFLERLYTGRFGNLAVGRTRYGLSCDESGVVVDDGIVARLADDRFYVSATSSGAAGAYREMQRWAMQWNLDVTLVNATNQLGAMNIAGPLSRVVLARCTDLNLSREEFPFLNVREATVAGVRAIIVRVGFVGELGYEIHVPAGETCRVWSALLEAGADEDIQLFGVEAQRLLRLEKGHLIVAQDTDGLTTPFEAGLAWAVNLGKPFFVGQRSLEILKRKPLARTLVGFTLPRTFSDPLPKECHLVIENGEIGGRVTSVAHSFTLGHVIGIAYVSPTNSEPGSPIAIRVDDGKLVHGTVVKTPFYDPDNERQELDPTTGEAKR